MIKEGLIAKPNNTKLLYKAQKISEYIDYHLQPIVREIPSNIKDRSDFLCKLKPTTEVPENSYIETINVKSLCTSIPNFEGKKAVKISHENFTTKTTATKVITIFLALILTLNNFIFNSKNFLETKGCAIYSWTFLSENTYIHY